MEPINLHVDGAGTVSRWSRRPDHGDYTMVPRADYDALVKERDDWRDTALAAYAAAHGLDWRAATPAQIDAMEADAKAAGDTKAMDVVRRLYARAEKAERERDEARDRADRRTIILCQTACERDEARARAEKAEEALRFYADRANYRFQNDAEGALRSPAVNDDDGAKAREALGDRADPTPDDARGVDAEAVAAARRLTDPEAATLEDHNP